MMIPHPHVWRRMTSDQDYAKFGPHWGGYKGYAEEICRLCGITRKCQSWQAWRYELVDAEKRVKYLLSTEPPRAAAALSDDRWLTDDQELGAENFGAEWK